MGREPMEWFTRRIRRIDGEKTEEREHTFPRETPVAIYVDSVLLATMAATPQDLEDLAMGFLFTERIIDGPSQVRELSAAADGRRGQIWATLRTEARLPSAPGISSGCGRGVSFLCASDLDGFPVVEGGGPYAPEGIRKAAEEMRKGAAAYRAGGGIHAAACLVGSRVESIAEDIGRHNAVDKALGALLRKGTPTRGAAILTTGRISSEMLLKAAVAGCPLTASMTGATSLAAEAAEKLGITLVTYVRGNRMDVCTHPERIEG
jgi:FdhD protein